MGLSLLGAGLAGGALAMPASASAGESDELVVAVNAPLGKGCISGEKLKVAVQKRVGSAARRKTVDVRIQTNDPEPGWMAEVSIAGQSGRRTVRTQSTSCKELDDGLLLVVVLLVDPQDSPAPAPPPKGGADKDRSRGRGARGWKRSRARVTVRSRARVTVRSRRRRRRGLRWMSLRGRGGG
ncbi:MAG: hypothetical protein R3F14_23135 [Polyangiaceae bacterium]